MVESTDKKVTKKSRLNRTSMEGWPILFLVSSLSSSILIISNAKDTITTTQFITDNETTIVSSDGSFEMGFFTPGSSKNRYLGIWYKKISTQTVVWVANRESPLTDASGVLKVIRPGILTLVGSNNTIIWSTSASKSAQEPVAQLLDSGNLVVTDAEDHNPQRNFIWESFDHPCDTLLPGMKMGKNFLTGHEQHLTSWTSDDDPASGDYTYHSDPSGYPQNVLMKGSREIFRSGPWNGIGFSGSPSLRHNPIYKYDLIFNAEEVYFSYQLLDNSIISRFVLNQSGYAQRWTWVDRNQNWALYLSLPTDICDDYGLCGAFGSCNVGNSPPCGCLSKFVPKDPKKWEMTEWSSGCVRRTRLDCYTDGFIKYPRLKFPDTQFSRFNESMGLEECESVCLRNCSCMAYANLVLREGGSGSGCLLWFGELIDFRDLAESRQDIYIRMASSELDSTVQQVGSKGKRKEIILMSLVLSIGGLLIGLTLTLYIWKRKKKKKKLKTIQMLREAGRLAHNYEQSYTNESQKEDYELPLFDLATIVNATDNFSINKKLGEGGFGPVYKGVLVEGQEIAVKRLSKESNQGLDEFKNEVIYIAKLQHRNLVKLLGCCIQGEEKMLIYEFMPNKSLDCYIFDETESTALDWHKRFNIINGIARGLLYLHQDSRLRIIHRDLKASNILLDDEKNPKISDFGMARSFGGNETEAKTSRVVGTYGYMSPEYAVDGLFSVKSDVFSFGVLLLEIVSGKRNRGFFHPDHNHNLLGHAWILYKEGRQMELIDASIGDSCYVTEVLRSIHVGLLCVQQCVEDRPNMSSVVLMMGSDGALPPPKQPGFFTERRIVEPDFSSGKQAPSSDCGFSITQLLPR